MKGKALMHWECAECGHLVHMDDAVWVGDNAYHVECTPNEDEVVWSRKLYLREEQT
jgi:hypothetical protein